MQHWTRAQPYPGQFATVPDLYFIAVPRSDIMAEILARGERPALADLYTAVAIVAEAVGAATDAAGRF
ncbi:MAG: hypothetical protein H6993_12850 [Pseudomonadales bacterium]|nr:hypothetical protein [Pseudomonadales bacterium]MCP5184847.1 hypothetical protein [Pseudomonadales bacterium]